MLVHAKLCDEISSALCLLSGRTPRTVLLVVVRLPLYDVFPKYVRDIFGMLNCLLKLLTAFS